MTNSSGKKIQLAVFDIDGTLSSYTLGLMPSAVEAMRHIASLGVPIAIGTGRCLSELPEEITGAVRLSYLIGINGSMVTDLRDGRILADHKIPRETSLRALETVRKYRSGYCVYDSDRDMADGESLKNWEYWLGPAGGYSWIPSDVVEDLGEYISASAGVSKICGYVRSEQVYRAMREEAEAIPGMWVTTAAEQEIECMPEGVDKGSALLELCRAEGIDPENVFCIGDGENDAGMLKVCGISVAMGNACEECRKASRYSTDECEKDGVYNAVMRFFR